MGFLSLNFKKIHFKLLKRFMREIGCLKAVKYISEVLNLILPVKKFHYNKKLFCLIFFKLNEFLYF